MKKITIAIDGYSSCGKSTLAKGIAKKFNYIYVDTGAMYRGVTLFCLQTNVIRNKTFNEREVVNALEKIHLEFAENKLSGISELFLNGKNIEKEIREMNVSECVSPVSAISEVRKKMIRIQREIGKNKGVVMDGRDIGTNVFPDAELKIFMTADPLVRANGRWEELKLKKINGSLEDVIKNISERDYADTHRKYNPLQKADDAIILDNTKMTPDEQLEFAVQIAKKLCQ